MTRMIIWLLVLAGLAVGFAVLLEFQGEVTIRLMGQEIETSIPVLVVAVVALSVCFSALWSLYRFASRLPSRLRDGADRRSLRKGLDVLTRGMAAAGAGDSAGARRAENELERLMPDEPLTQLLKAQVAQLEGDRAGAQAAFVAMANAPQTRLLGLRGLHIEAGRRGDPAAALAYAREAHRQAALPWAGEAVVRDQTLKGDWRGALETVEANARAGELDKASANRQRAVLWTAIAMEEELTDSEAALKNARLAVKLAPDLVPAVALAARLLSRRGKMKQGSRLIEEAWAVAPHPDLAAAYLDMRAGDSAADRAARAQTLARLAPSSPEARLLEAHAALTTRDFAAARAALAPLLEGGERPTARACLLMSEIEETENGPGAGAREWLARSAHARRDPAWTADGVVSENWAPASPVTGQLDAFRWEAPAEQIGLSAAQPELAPAPPPAAGRPALIVPAGTGETARPARDETPDAAREPDGPAPAAAQPAAPTEAVVFPIAPPDVPAARRTPEDPRKVV